MTEERKPILAGPGSAAGKELLATGPLAQISALAVGCSAVPVALRQVERQANLTLRYQPHCRSLMGVAVQATGSYLPELVVTNEDLEQRFGCDADWILQRTGIRERRHAPPHQATSDLCAEAGQRCLAAAGVEPTDVDLVLVATFTPDMPIPSTACLVQDRLHMRCPAFDIQAACSGFMYALVTGASFIVSGVCRQVLVIGGDCVSRTANPQDVKSFPLFSDGAGAVLLGPGRDNQGLVSYVLGADGSGADLLSCPAGGSRLPASPERLAQGLQYLHMNGRAVYRWAVATVSASIQDALDASGLGADDIDLFILHQANLRIINAVIDAVPLPRQRVFNNLELCGNSSAGSIPLALDAVHQTGSLRAGQQVLLSGFGAGLTWGTSVLRW